MVGSAVRVTVEETQPNSEHGHVVRVSLYPGCFAEVDRVTWALRIFFVESGDRTVTIPADEWVSFTVSRVD